MNSNEINVDGEKMQLPTPFFVIASQNPLNQIGTSPLPESQLDRFLMRISLGTPSRDSEKKILKGEKILVDSLDKIISIKDLQKIQNYIDNLEFSDELYEYILDLLTESRKLKSGGLSTRAAIGLVNASKACAFIKGDKSIIPDNVHFIFSSVTEHRLYN